MTPDERDERPTDNRCWPDFVCDLCGRKCEYNELHDQGYGDLLCDGCLNTTQTLLGAEGERT